MPGLFVSRAATRAAPTATALATAANSLQAGQSIKFADLPSSLLQFSGENADFIKYGSSAVWDPIRKQVRFVGRRQSIDFPYHGLVYTESTDTWANNWPLWSSATVTSGHGYDHNAVNPANGHHFFRLYNSDEVYEEDGAGNWTLLPALAPHWSVAGGLSYVPSLGLIYNDRKTIQLLENGAWNELEYSGDLANAYHAVSQYNPNCQLLIYGAGNLDKAFKSLNLSRAIADIPTPSIELGSADGQGVLAHDPNGNDFIGWQKLTKSWQKWKPGDLAWSNLTQSVGTGASPQSGTPNLDDSASGQPCIAASIPAHDQMTKGVVMYIQSQGGAGQSWLYRHS